MTSMTTQASGILRETNGMISSDLIYDYYNLSDFENDIKKFHLELKEYYYAFDGLCCVGEFDTFLSHGTIKITSGKFLDLMN